MVRTSCRGDTGEVFHSLGLDASRPLVALLPGSRRAEVESLLPPFLAVFRRIRAAVPGTQAAVSCAGPHLIETVLRLARGAGEALPVWKGSVHTLVRASSLVLAASGTVNLEVALLERPLVVFYRTSLLNYLAARFVVELKWISPVNIILGEEAVPEYVQRIPVQEAATAAVDLLRDGPSAAAQREAARRITRIAGAPGVTGRIAEWLIEEVRSGTFARG